MVATMTSTFPCIHSFCASVRSPAFKPAKVYPKVWVISDPEYTPGSKKNKKQTNEPTCMIWFGQDAKLSQLVSHSFTAFPGSTVNDPAALYPNTNIYLRQQLSENTSGWCNRIKKWVKRLRQQFKTLKIKLSHVCWHSKNNLATLWDSERLEFFLYEPEIFRL